MQFNELQKEMIAALKAGEKVRKNAISNLIFFFPMCISQITCIKIMFYRVEIENKYPW